jgi:hypothetical protein
MAGTLKALAKAAEAFTTACGSLEVVEGQLDLTFEIGFGCSIVPAADLPRNKKQIA